MTCTRYTRFPRNAAAAPLTAQQVARAYNFPAGDGTGRTVALIELGGGFTPSQFPGVGYIELDGGKNAPDGPDGADGEVQLDIGVVQGVAPGANIKVVFCPNTDAGFLAGIHWGVTSLRPGDVISISWGGPESEWSTASVHSFDAAFATARENGIYVTVASGDTGADDGTGTPTCDFPASSPHVIACGGTRLELNGDGTRAAETAWNDNPTQSATGGGTSKVFPGRQVPDIAGNADPDTGYKITVDGEQLVIGGTSAVAPLVAGGLAIIGQALGDRAGSFDLMNTLLTNPGVCYDVVAGDNRAGPGRDTATGLGVPDFGRLAQIVLDAIPDPIPAPVTPAPPTPAPPVTGNPAVQRTFPNGTANLEKWAGKPHMWHLATEAKKEWDGSVVVTANAAHVQTGHHAHAAQDARTGRYVSDEYAAEHPETTFRES